jgi:uncharacterized protein (DUF4415 family)
MAKKQSASSRPEKLVVKSAADIHAYTKSPAFRRDLKRARAIRDNDIDYSDIPELTDEELDRMVRARAARLRRLKRPISIRIEPAVLQWLKRSGPGYQTRINELLREAMERSLKRAG